MIITILLARQRLETKANYRRSVFFLTQVWDISTAEEGFNNLLYSYRIHAISIANSREYCYELIKEHLEEFKITAEARDLVNVIGDYVGEGYGKYSDDDLRM